MVFIIKFDGRKEEFDREKIIRTCLRVGVGREKSEELARKIESSVKDGMTTKEIYKNLMKELKSFEKKAAAAYSIREIVSELPPDIFELFVKKILETHGYKCNHNVLIKGLCVEHQVDIIARNDWNYLVECKRHRNPHRFCGLITSLQVYARFEDIKDGFKSGKNVENFDRAWIITNTKFSDHAIQYAQAKNIMLTGWNFPHEMSFAKMIDDKLLYPITVLRIKKSDIERLFAKGIITIHDIEEKNLRECIDEKTTKNIIDQKKRLLR